MSTLTRHQELLLRQLRHRHGRKKHPLCLVEGIRCVREMHALRPDLLEFAVAAESFPAAPELSGMPVIRLSDRQFGELANTVAAPGILLVARRPVPAAPPATPPHPWVPVLDRVADPGNLGTILRTARAAGVTEVWLTSGTADPFGDKAIRAATAAQFALSLREFPDLAAIAAELRRRRGGALYCTDPHRGENLFTVPDLFSASAIVFGNEANGAADLPEARPVNIPMPGGGESLNVAQAATIVLGEFVRRTTSPGAPPTPGAP